MKESAEGEGVGGGGSIELEEMGKGAREGEKAGGESQLGNKGKGREQEEGCQQGKRGGTVEVT